MDTARLSTFQRKNAGSYSHLTLRHTGSASVANGQELLQQDKIQSFVVTSQNQQVIAGMIPKSARKNAGVGNRDAGEFE